LSSVLKVLSESSSYVVSGLSPDRLDEEFLQAWDALFEAQPVPSNPFLARPWVLRWYDHFVQPADRVILVVRAAGGGAVVGIVPMHLHRPGIGPVSLARRLLPVGAGLGQTPFEIPGLLCAEGSARDVGRAVVSACLEADVDWAELAVSPEQCWFDADWLNGSSAAVTFGDHARPRACVVLPLAATWDATRSTMKRNIKESIRRSANRLKKDGRPWEVVRHSTGMDRSVVERFLLLHDQRSQLQRTTSHRHHNAYEEHNHSRLMLDALPELGRTERASMFELYLDAEHVASQLALHSPGTSYVHSSGFREDVWPLGVATHLQAELVRHAVDRGDSVVNFSPGPNVSKLRWSERLWVTHEFAFGAGPRSLTWRFAGFTMLSSLKATRRAASRHRADRQAAQS
jgi:hypothetical protein